MKKSFRIVSLVVVISMVLGISGVAWGTPGSEQADINRPAYDGADCAQNEVLVTMDKGYAQSRVMSTLSVDGMKVTDTIGRAQSAEGSINVVQIPETMSVEEAIDTLEDKPGVVRAQPNFRYYLMDEVTTEAATDESDEASARSLLPQMTVDDPAAQSTDSSDPINQWYLEAANVFDAWDYAQSNKTSSVAIIDSGITRNHEDLLNNIDFDHAWDATKREKLTRSDEDGHGTHVAGIAGAQADNATGIAGAAFNPNIVPIAVFDEAGGCYTDDIVAAYEYLMNLRDLDALNLHVINMSLGGYGSVPEDVEFERVIHEAQEDYNIVTVAAGGNGDDYGNPITMNSYPSDFEDVVSVVALESATERVFWSDYNNCKDIAAPGVDIYSTYNTSSSGYKKASGTSMASPLVAGIFTLMFSLDPNLTVQEAKDIVYATAVDLGEPGKDDYYGYGAIDAAAAMDRVNSLVSTGIDLSDAQVTLSQDNFTYTGQAYKPAATITYYPSDGTPVVLTEGVDYHLTYVGNITAGTGYVYAYGRGDYSGKAAASFTINRATGLSVAAQDVSATYDTRFHATTATTNITEGTSILYKQEDGTYSSESPRFRDAADHMVEFKAENNNYVTAEGSAHVLIAPRAITVTVDSASKVFGEVDPKFSCTVKPSPYASGDIGSVVAVRATADAAKEDAGSSISLVANYTENPNYAVTIKPGTLSITPTYLSGSSIADIPDQTFTGKPLTPAATLSYQNRTLVEGVDYDVSYDNNVEIGTAQVVCTGRGNFSGTKRTGFTIVEEPTSPKPDDPDKKPPVTTPDWTTGFSDVDRMVVQNYGTLWFVDEGYLSYVVKGGFMSGYTDKNGKPTGLFGPDDAITRAQVACILYRNADGASFGSTTDPSSYAPTALFDDEEVNAYYTAAINWAKENGILTGDASSNYTTVRPGDGVTREELCTMLQRFAALKGQAEKGTVSGSDIRGMNQVSSWAQAGVDWAVSWGIVGGFDNGNGTFTMAPQQGASRCQMAKMTTVLLRDVIA